MSHPKNASEFLEHVRREIRRAREHFARGITRSGLHGHRGTLESLLLRAPHTEDPAEREKIDTGRKEVAEFLSLPYIRVVLDEKARRRRRGRKQPWTPVQGGAPGLGKRA